MRKIYSILGVAALSTLALVSCNKEAIDPAITPAEGNKVTLTINATQSTKTYIDGTSVKWAASGEKLKVFQIPDSIADSLKVATSSEGTTENDGATMSFAVSFDKVTADSLSYYAFYPSSAYDKKPSSVESVAIEIPSTQTPTATSFDSAADILVAKPQTVTTQATSLDMAFARVVAVGKMTLTGLASSDPVTKVTFSATDAEGNAVTLAGKTAYNLNDASVVRNNTKAESIILDYSSLSLTANESMDVWFTCLPFSLEGAGSFKVVVETATQTFTKEVSFTSGQKLNFIAGKAARFSVNMSSATADTKAKDLCYAELTYEDFTGGEGYASSGYNNVTVNKTHGDTWSMNATNQSSTIGLKKSTSSENSSYIKLPDFVSNITSVLVTCSGTATTDSLALRTSTDFSDNYIAGVTLASGTTEATYTFDLSSQKVKTAYLKAFNHQIKVTKVVVYAGTDTRTALTAPANLTAAVDAETVNTINVSWDAVTGAGSYTVTLSADGASDVVVTATNTSYVFSDLAYETEYLIAVVANPSDYYINKDSDGAVPEDFVKTGAKPAGAETVYYVLNSASTAVATASAYNAYTGQTCASDNSSSTLQSATWSVTIGNKSTTSPTGLWLGSNSKQKAKMILSNGSVTGASAIATALGVTTTDTYYAALICNTDFANISKVVLTRSGVGGTAPSNVYLLYSTDSGSTYTLAGTASDAETITYTIDSPVKSARYAIVIKSTSNCQYKVPVLTFYSKDSGSSTTTTLSTPANVTASVSGSTLTASWDAVSNATSYEWSLYSDSAKTNIVGEGTVTTNSLSSTASGTGDWEISEFTAGSTYYFTVVAKADGYTNSAEGEANFTVSSGSSTESTTATINFGNATGSTEIDGTSVTGDDSAGNTWTVTTVTSSESFTPNASYSQVGSSKKPATSITFTTTLATSATIESFSIKLGGFSGTAGTVSLKVGDTEVGTGSLNATNDVTVSSTTTATGTVLTATITSISKGVKVYNIEYKYH